MTSVLIVDDLHSERLTLTALCRSLGLDVHCAKNTVEAASILEAHRPRAVIVDLVMPGADGFDCLFMISKLSPTISVAVTTASDKLLLKAAAELTDGYGLKHVALMQKPIGIDELREFFLSSGVLSTPAKISEKPVGIP